MCACNQKKEESCEALVRTSSISLCVCECVCVCVCNGTELVRAAQRKEMAVTSAALPKHPDSIWEAKHQKVCGTQYTSMLEYLKAIVEREHGGGGIGRV